MGPKNEIAALIAEHDDDHELAAALSQISRWEIAQHVSWWGPLLYARNRRAFLPLIERCADPWTLRGTKDLDGWMTTADANGDTRLWRALYQASLQQGSSWSEAPKRWRADFLGAFRDAADRGSRRDVVEKYSLWYDVEDDFAAELYRIDPVVTRDFITWRFERLQWFDLVYEQTAELARANGDDEFYFELYRRTFTQDHWTKDVLELAESIGDPQQLCRELDRRHLRSVDGGDVAPETLGKLLVRRGADVVPYLERRVSDVASWGQEKAWRTIARAALERGFDNLWSIVVKTHFNVELFGEEVTRILESAEPQWRKMAWLSAIAGAKFGWAEWRNTVPLDAKVALALYDAFPEVCRGPIAVHLILTTQEPYLALAQHAAAAGDTVMVDVLAAKAAMVNAGWYSRAPIENVQWYASHYEALDDVTFAARAVHVLGMTKFPEHNGRKSTRRDNPVYRVFFRDVRRYRPALGQVRDLLEATNEDARRVGLRLIVEAGPEGADAAMRNSDHLLAYLLNEASRGSRIDALNALALAAEQSRVIADQVLFRAREALDLRRKRYPRDRVIELIGRIVHRWPDLRDPREVPVVFGAAEPVEAAW